jgi:hypothetical protein
MTNGRSGSVQVTGGRGTISVFSGRDLGLELCYAPVEVCSMLFVPDRGLDELGRRLYGHKERESIQPLPSNRTVEGCGDDDSATDQCRLNDVLGLSREHQQAHKGRPCVATQPQRTPRMSSQSSIVQEHETEQEPDVFGDKHFCGDYDFDEDILGATPLSSFR